MARRGRVAGGPRAPMIVEATGGRRVWLLLVGRKRSGNGRRLGLSLVARKNLFDQFHRQLGSLIASHRQLEKLMKLV